MRFVTSVGGRAAEAPIVTLRTVAAVGRANVTSSSDCLAVPAGRLVATGDLAPTAMACEVRWHARGGGGGKAWGGEGGAAGV